MDIPGNIKPVLITKSMSFKNKEGRIEGRKKKKLASISLYDCFLKIFLPSTIRFLLVNEPFYRSIGGNAEDNLKI